MGVLGVLACLGLGGLAWAQEFEEKPEPMVGQVAPELGTVVWRHLPASEGKPREPRIADYRGQVVVVHTWVWFCDS